MKQDLELFFQTALKDKKALDHLKNAAILSRNYELAAEIREIELINFPKTEDQKSANKEAEDIRMVFRMADLNVPLAESWLINQVVKAYIKHNCELTIKDTSELVAKMHQLFD